MRKNFMKLFPLALCGISAAVLLAGCGKTGTEESEMLKDDVEKNTEKKAAPLKLDFTLDENAVYQT